MEFSFRELSAQDAQHIAGWHYPEPYAFYDWTADPDDLAELLDPERRARWYHAALNERGDLVGFLSLRENQGTVLIGLGLRPDLTGRGHGLPFLLEALAFARDQFTVITFRLMVATFNRRAIRVYERAGFRSGRILLHQTNGGEHEFLEMSRDA